MNEEFDLDDFESLLRNQTEKHRMYPSDAVWRNINSNLHGKRRWPALTFSAILIGAILTAGFIFLHPNKNLFDHPEFLVENNNAGKSNIIVASNQNNPSKNKLAAVRALKKVDEKSVIYSINQMASPVGDMETTIVETEASFNMPSNGGAMVSLNEPVNNQPQPKAALETTPKTSAAYKQDNHTKKIVAPNGLVVLQSALQQPPSTTIDEENATPNSDDKEKVAEKTDVAKTEENTIDKSAFPESHAATVKLPKEKIEHPWEISFYATPSISYRNLSLDQSYDYHYSYNPALTGNPQTNVNKYVNQSPSIGIGAGASVSYAVSKRFKLTGGLQFNFRQYNLKAYVTSTQQASLLLNRGGYADSLITYSNIRTEGVNAVNIGNYYFQMSAPIGFQYTAIQGKKVDIMFGATLQPTYQFNKNMYMLTSDFKAYTLEPSLARRWNINTGVEITARFKAAGLQWEVGPQLRYQMMPTQISSYIIHENLIDYGLKIGIVKQLK